MESLHILLALLTLSMTSLHPEALSGKIIVFGGGGPTGGCPDTKMFLDHVAEWEEFLSVDGVLLATNPKSGLYWADAWFTGKKYLRADFDLTIQNLKDARPKRYTENYMRLNVLPGDVDWFDDQGWGAVLHNAVIAAEVVREGGLAGIFLDTEQYNQKMRPFFWPHPRAEEKRTLKQYQEQVFKRGLLLGRTWKPIMGEKRLLLTYGPSHVVVEMGGKANSNYYVRSSMPLLPAFIDGLMAGGIEIVDAHEKSYFYKRQSEFAAARRIRTMRRVPSRRLAVEKVDVLKDVAQPLLRERLLDLDVRRHKLVLRVALADAAVKDPAVFCDRHAPSNNQKSKLGSVKLSAGTNVTRKRTAISAAISGKASLM